VFTIQPTVDTDPKVIPDSARVDTLTTKFADGYVFDTKRDERQTVAQMNVELPFHLVSSPAVTSRQASNSDGLTGATMRKPGV